MSLSRCEWIGKIASRRYSSTPFRVVLVKGIICRRICRRGIYWGCRGKKNQKRGNGSKIEASDDWSGSCAGDILKEEKNKKRGIGSSSNRVWADMC